MKSVLISIQPKWCEVIANGKKTVEVRKTKPKTETPFKVYIYCTKNKEKLIDVIHDGDDMGDFIHRGKPNFIKAYKDLSLYGLFNGGKVIGEFVCDKVEQGHILWVKEQPKYYEKTDEKTQLTYRQMLDYLGEKGIGYFWHISDLVIYDKPKELSEFKKINRECWYADLGLAKRDCPECQNKGCFVQRPPQSWCYVEELG